MLLRPELMLPGHVVSSPLACFALAELELVTELRVKFGLAKGMPCFANFVLDFA